MLRAPRLEVSVRIEGCVSVNKIRIGRHTVGIVGLRRALDEAVSARLSGREEVTEAVFAAVTPDNYIPDSQRELYEEAFWREYLRHTGQGFGHLFVPLECVVQGGEGKVRDQFVATLTAVLAGFELAPQIVLEPPEPGGRQPALVVDGEKVIEGNVSKREMWKVLWRRLTDW